MTITSSLLVLGGIAVLVGGSIRGFAAQAPKYKERLETMSAGLMGWLQEHGINVQDQLVADMIEDGCGGLLDHILKQLDP